MDSCCALLCVLGRQCSLPRANSLRWPSPLPDGLECCNCNALLERRRGRGGSDGWRDTNARHTCDTSNFGAKTVLTIARSSLTVFVSPRLFHATVRPIELTNRLVEEIASIHFIGAALRQCRLSCPSFLLDCKCKTVIINDLV